MISSRDFIEHAEALRANGLKEAEHRASVSRLYFGVFHFLANHPSSDNAPFSNTGEDHRALISYFKTHKDERLRAIGFRHLSRLRALRNHADYILYRQFPSELTDEAFEKYDDIVACITKQV